MAETVSESNGLTFLWKIQNYDKHALRENDFFQSPIFPTTLLNHSKWRLKLYPFETVTTLEGKTDKFLVIEIEKISGLMETSVAVSFHLITSNGLYHVGDITERKFYANDTFMMHVEKSSRLKEIFENGSVFSLNNTLTLRCHLWNADTSAQPSAVYSCLTQFPLETHSFYWSWRCEKEGLKLVWGKKLFPKSKVMPILEIRLAEQRSSYNRNAHLSIRYFLLNADKTKNYTIHLDIFISNENRPNQRLKFMKNFSYSISDNNYFQIERYPFHDGNIYKFHFDVSLSSNEVLSQIENSDIPHTEHNMKLGLQKNECENQITVKNTSIEKKVSKPFLRGVDSLLEDLSLLLIEKKFCDVTLKIKGKDFFAHKGILSARSSVFNTMFESDMKEKETGVVEIDDIDSDTFEIFLKYLYQGKFDSFTNENAISLYSAADKYQVLSLKSECSSYILQHLSEENVCDILILSDMHQDKELKNAALEMFCIHSKSVLLTKDWDALLLKRTELAREALREMALKM